jgi:hypothetical protein
MTATYWVALAMAGCVLAFGLLLWVMPRDFTKFDEAQLRGQRTYLEGRTGIARMGKYVVVGWALTWFVTAVDHLVRGSGRGFLYLIPCVMFFLGLWILRWRKRIDLERLGDRGLTPRPVQGVAEIWYRVWGTVLVVGIFGPEMVEYFSEQTFSDSGLFADPVSTLHTLLSLVSLAAVLGFGITYLSTRERATDGNQRL